MCKRAAVLVLALLAVAAQAAVFKTGGPSTTNNDDTCDIAFMPAATLLLPYFEVDLADRNGQTTVFTVTNVVDDPQVARVTLWTEYAYPVMTFNIFLTGYDVQSINLFDVIAAGRIAPDEGTGFRLSNVGELSGDFVNDITWDNPLVDEASCVDLPVQLPAAYVTRMQQAFTTGRLPAMGNLPACNFVGGPHANAVGYATIDVVGFCTATLPTEPAYFQDDIRFDNVLIGDYQQIDRREEYAQGNPMVHIRAIPEGHLPQDRDDGRFDVNFPRTFYDRYVPAGSRRDARQPLPSLFAVRWIDGGPSGYTTALKIWREGSTKPATICSSYPLQGGNLGITEQVRFDEEENPETLAPDVVVTPIRYPPVLPSTSRTFIDDEDKFAPNTQGAVSGWLYLNLDSVNAVGSPPASQNWVVVSMFAENRFGVDLDAAVLGNGCTPETDQSEAVGGINPIGPAPNYNPSPPRP